MNDPTHLRLNAPIRGTVAPKVFGLFPAEPVEFGNNKGVPRPAPPARRSQLSASQTVPFERQPVSLRYVTLGCTPTPHLEEGGKTRLSTGIDRRSFAHGFCHFLRTRLSPPERRKTFLVHNGMFKQPSSTGRNCLPQASTGRTTWGSVT